MTTEQPYRPQLVSPEAPWLGLRSFNENTAAFFFGRTEELNDLFERILDRPLTILFGQSGLGKSSLLQGALIPHLRLKGLLPVLIRLDHDSSALPLEQQLLQQLRDALQAAGFNELAHEISRQLSESKPALDHAAFLWMIFHNPAYGFVPIRGTNADRLAKPVFLIDQFEEIFTLGDRPERRTLSLAFRESLATLVENRIPPSLRAAIEADDKLSEQLDYKVQVTRVLLSLREDFLYLLERWRRSIPSVMENRLELHTLNGLKAFEAVSRPGQLRHAKPPIISNELGRLVVRFVAGASKDVPLEEIDAVPPLLSLVCSELNAQRLLSGAEQVTEAQFEGNSSDILSSFYNRSFQHETYGSTSPLFAPALTAARRLIEDRLLSADGFRESIAFDTVARELSRAAGGDEAKAALDALVARRLLTVEVRGGVRRVELTHDVLTEVVKSSRDQRQEEEAVARAKVERKQAETETARIRIERNRLRRLALLLTSLAVVAVIGLIIAWIEFRRSTMSEAAAVIAKNNAIEAKALAQQRFESTWASLTKLYDNYASDTLENTPGLSIKLSTALRSKLRSQLLEQLYKLNQEHPDHRGTQQYITLLLVDEGYDDIGLNEYRLAKDATDKANVWSQKIPLDSADAAETRAEILLQESVTNWQLLHDNQNNNVESFDARTRREIESMLARWPDSWRLQYSLVVAAAFEVFDRPENRSEVEQLDHRLIPIMIRSNYDYKVVGRHLWLMQLALWGQGNFASTANDFERERKVITEFRTIVLGTKPYTLLQMERLCGRLTNMIDFAEKKLVNDDAATAPARRAVIEELESTITALENRLPNSILVYQIRGDLLRLQEASLKTGIATYTADELKTALTRHRMIASRMGIGSSVADVIGQAFQQYFQPGATADARAAAAGTVRDALSDYGILDLVNVEIVLQDNRISTNAEQLLINSSDSPLAAAYQQMLARYVDLFQHSGRDEQIVKFKYICSLMNPALRRWAEASENERVLQFWQLSVRDIPLKEISGDESVISTVQTCVIALVHGGRLEEADHQIIDLVGMCDSAVGKQPWNTFLKTYYLEACFKIAERFPGNSESPQIQVLLKKGWSLRLQLYGKESLLSRYAKLPMSGDPPPGATPSDAEFFLSFAPDSTITKWRPIRIRIYTDFDGKMYPADVDIFPGPNGYSGLMGEFRWLKEIRGGLVPDATVQLFARLQKEATAKNVDYAQYCDKEYWKAVIQPLGQDVQTLADQLAQTSSEAKHSEVRSRLEGAYDRLTATELSLGAWEQLEKDTSRWLEIIPKASKAQVRKVLASYCGGHKGDAIEQLKKYWTSDDCEFAMIGAAEVQALPRGVASDELKRLYIIAVENHVSFPELAAYAVLSPPTTRTSAESVKQSNAKAAQASTQPKDDSITRTIALVYGKLNNGKPFWIYVAVKTNKYDQFSKAYVAGKLDLYNFKEYGEIIVSGEGNEPSDEITDKVADMYQTDRASLKKKIDAETRPVETRPAPR